MNTLLTIAVDILFGISLVLWGAVFVFAFHAWRRDHKSNKAFDAMCERGELDAIIAETDEDRAAGRALDALDALEDGSHEH